jgi:hypothetical protein
MYFSEELHKAIEMGYTIKVLSGYLFDKGYLFDNYVTELYRIKESSERGTPMYTIAKLLLNSLYGRFGMNPVAENHVIVSEDEADNIHAKFRVTDVTKFNNGKELISYLFKESEGEKSESKLNINVAISSAITSYARIYMYKFKTLKGYELYYSDTDSLDLNKPLPEKYLNDNELGKFKIEHLFDEVIYIAPKVYGGISNSKDVVKIKGLKDPVEFSELKKLLKKDERIDLHQEKWYRDFENANIRVQNESYTLMATANKRDLLYDSCNNLSGTRPLILSNGSILKP